MWIKWKINSSRWLCQSVVGESKNFWSITIPALFESSAERLITLLEASSRKKAFVTVSHNLTERFSELPWKVSLCTHYLVHQTREVDRNIRHWVSVFFMTLCTQPSGRTHSLRSHSEWSSQYHQEIFWHLIAQYFRQLYYVWSFDRLIDAISSFHHALDLQYFLKYWKEPITHLAILAQPPPYWITLQSHCQNQLILFIQKDVN